MQHPFKRVRRGYRRSAALIGPLPWPGAALPASAAGTLDKAKDSGKRTIGYAADLRPFAYSDGASRPVSPSRCATRSRRKSELKLGAERRLRGGVG
jgi:hypothetical protein